ncbi:Adenylylsulfatase HINT3 [Citrus sinensis]|uniref:Adenylylsulfatase HINT3 n=1 Tax=Citrus sinensis TaxID=2711 RepID=A0ACB8LC27_CITSI|nr:Adenylylsulfatase HINT3 [Citrus sinensis]
MGTPKRRLAVLSSHLLPTGPAPCSSSSGVSASFCAQQRLSHSQESGHENDCVFCKIIRGESPAVKLYEYDTCLCILDTNPLSLGHSLIVPKSHFSCLDATPPSVVAAMCAKVPLISNAIMKATDADSFNLLVNNGAAAGQVIFHTHIHIIPRKARDCLWTSEVTVAYLLSYSLQAKLKERSINVWSFSRV